MWGHPKRRPPSASRKFHPQLTEQADRDEGRRVEGQGTQHLKPEPKRSNTSPRIEGHHVAPGNVLIKQPAAVNHDTPWHRLEGYKKKQNQIAVIMQGGRTPPSKDAH